MNDKQLYEQILGIKSPWHVEQVELKLADGQVLISVEGTAATEVCPECGAQSPRYDRSERRWRHLDTCQYETILIATVPRVRCREHGVRQVRLPWAEERSRFTAMFEALVIDWRHEGQPGAFDLRLLDATALKGIRLIAFGGLSEPLALRKALEAPGVVAVAQGNFLNYREHAIQVLKQQLEGLPLRAARYEA